MKQIAQVIISIILLCVLIGAISYFTGLDVAGLIVSGFRQLRESFSSLF